MLTRNFGIEESQLVSLSDSEMMDVQGGESAWYWVAYGVGNAYHTVKEAYHEIVNSPDYSTPIG